MTTFKLSISLMSHKSCPDLRQFDFRLTVIAAAQAAGLKLVSMEVGPYMGGHKYSKFSADLVAVIKAEDFMAAQALAADVTKTLELIGETQFAVKDFHVYLG